MSDLGDTFREWNNRKKEKRVSNGERSREILLNAGVPFKVLSDSHLRVGQYDFWPSTGLFINCKTKNRGRGVFNLLNKLKGATDDTK